MDHHPSADIDLDRYPSAVDSQAGKPRAGATLPQALPGLPSGRGYLYPAFQFDAARRDVAPEVRAVNEQLDAAGDPWGVASWWISRNDRLAARPRDLVGTERAGELAAAARALTEPLG